MSNVSGVRKEDAFGEVRHGFAPAGSPGDISASSVPPRHPELSQYQQSASQEGAPPLRATVRNAIVEGKAYASAEIKVLKARGAVAAEGGKTIAIGGLIALLFGHLALVALTIGMLFVAISYLGPWVGTLLTVAVLLVPVVVFGLRAKAGLGTIKQALRKEAA